MRTDWTDITHSLTILIYLLLTYFDDKFFIESDEGIFLHLKDTVLALLYCYNCDHTFSMKLVIFCCEYTANFPIFGRKNLQP